MPWPRILNNGSRCHEMDRRAIVGGIITSNILELMICPAIHNIWQGGSVQKK